MYLTQSIYHPDPYIGILPSGLLARSGAITVLNSIAQPDGAVCFRG